MSESDENCLCFLADNKKFSVANFFYSIGKIFLNLNPFVVILNLNLVGRRKTLECFGRCGVYKMMTNLNMNSLDKLHT